jgi:predicted ATPase/class 3 adenylate cyclase
MRALNGPASDRQASDRQASDRTSQTRGAIIDRVCLQCHAPADPTNRFCGRCGTPLHTRCGSCLAIVAPGLDFCTNCGSALFPPLREPDAVREERRTVSVLFIDLAGFTGFAERLDPEDLRQLQVAYFSTASGVIRRYGGIVEKYIGDAVMAVFGVPVETEHDAYRAVRAALELQRELDNRPLAGRYRLRARVGVATGEALVDLAAARHAGEALVSGDVVATAARLQAHAPHGGVLVSASTRRATYASIRYGDQPQQVQLAGRSGLVEVWLAEGQVGRELTIDDEVTPLVGRDHELDLLTTALMRCVREREAGLVCVVGAHGLGKSRLVRELGRRIDAVPELVVRWRVGRCLPYGEGATYAALAEIVKTQSDVQDNDDPATTRQRLATVLAEVLPPSDVDRLAQLIGPLAGLPGRAVSPGEIEAAWQEALLALARHTPTVLVVEDLHFADPAMRKFLAGLVEAASDVPLFVLCTHRPELLDEQPTWAATLPGTLTASLGPLRGARLRELIATLLHSQDMPEELTDRLATITGGNPMYAVEYTRMLAERAAGAGLDLDAELEIPETVHGVVANRIDLLGPAERTVLHAAAVLGERVWPGAIAAMLSVGPAEVAQPLQGLQRRDMLVMANASAVAGESELAFRHLLLRDVAYRRLPRATRAALHRRAAQWFDQVSAEGRDDLAAAVAHHRVAVLTLTGGLGEDTTNDAEAARRALTAAADAAFAVYAVGPALSDVKQALNLWPTDQDPQRRNTTELLRWRLEFLHDDQRFYRESGAKKVARVADRMREDGDRHGEARAETLLGQVELVRAEREKAAEHLHRAIALFSELPDDAAKAEAYNELARLYMVEFAPAHALTAAQKTRELAQRLGLVDAAADALVTEASARYLTAEPDALAELERAVQLCRAQRLPSLRRATHNLATLLQEEGNLTRAAELWAENRQAQGAHDSLVFHHSEEAEWAYFTGDWVTLLRAAEEYLQRDTETTEWDLQLRCRRAWIQTLCDESAGEDLARCLDTARRSGFTRLAFCAYAHAAFASALAGAHGPAADLLGELTSTWRTAPTAMTVEWLSAAAHASALITSGRSTTQGAGAADVARNVAAVVDTAVRPTRWVAAAEKLVAGSSAAAAGRLAEASQQWAAAVEGYDDIGASSDAVLAATWTARASRAAGDEAGAEPYEARVRTFAERNRAPGLLALLD